MIKEKSPMKIFVSGTYDILHAGHIQFFKDALAFGREVAPDDFKISLIVSFCSDANLLLYKGRHSSIPDDNKQILLESIRYIERVYKGTDDGGIWDFVPAFLIEKPDYLAITTDDSHAEEKRKFCEDHGCKLVVLSKTKPMATSTSTSAIIKNLSGVKV